MNVKEVQNSTKIRDKLTESVFMVMVLLIPVIVSQILLQFFHSSQYWISATVLSLANCISIAVLIYWSSTNSGRAVFSFGNINSLEIKDLLIGIGYFLLTVFTMILCVFLILEPFGLLNAGYQSFNYSEQGHLAFVFFIINTITWVIFEEMFFRKYLFDRFKKAFTSSILFGVTLLSVNVLYQLIFFPYDFDVFYAFISLFSIISYMRGRKLIRPIINNVLSTILLYMLMSGLLNKILHLN